VSGIYQIISINSTFTEMNFGDVPLPKKALIAMRVLMAYTVPVMRPERLSLSAVIHSGSSKNVLLSDPSKLHVEKEQMSM